VGVGQDVAGGRGDRDGQVVGEILGAVEGQEDLLFPNYYSLYYK
jgi:hypothetical protein